jgi:hypothetical protein
LRHARRSNDINPPVLLLSILYRPVVLGTPDFFSSEKREQYRQKKKNSGYSVANVKHPQHLLKRKSERKIENNQQHE